MADSTMAISDLPQELVEEVISRVPLTSLRAVRTTCKNWNTLFKHRRFTRKHIRKSRAATKKKEFMAIMMMDSSAYLMSVNLRGIHNDYDDDGNNTESLIIYRKAKLISLNDGDRVDILRVFHCSGLLLCTTEEKQSRLVVLNPYRGQTRWIDEPIDHDWDRNMCALGYEKKKNSQRSHKILRSIEKISRFVDKEGLGKVRHHKYQIYNFNSDSWKYIYDTPDMNIRFYSRGVSLKGNTYWLARWQTNWFIQRSFCSFGRRQPFGGPRRVRLFEKPKRFQERVRNDPDFFLLCFDFTRERFGPCLPLPFHSGSGDSVALSSVREDQLTVLRQRHDTMEIWISKKIEPEAASWSKLFLAVDMKTLVTNDQFPFEHESFFVEERKKVVVVFAKDEETGKHVVAYIIGKDGYFKEVKLGESSDKHYCPLVCSYVPSSVQIKQAAPRGNHN